MTHSILLVFEIPDVNDLKAVDTYRAACNNMRTISQHNKNIQVHGQGCLVLPIKADLLTTLSEIQKEKLGAPYTYTVVPSDLEWHVVKK